MIASFSISDLLAFVVALSGMVFAIAYIMDQYFSPPRTACDEEIRDGAVAWLTHAAGNDGLSPFQRVEILLRDYETANGEVGRRDHITLIVGTILVGASFLILGNAAGTKSDASFGIHAFASVGLFTLWLLLLHDTAKRLNYIAFARMRGIEVALAAFLQHGAADQAQSLGFPNHRFGIHSYFDVRTGNQTAKWLRLRRCFWAWVLLFLCLSWMLLSLSVTIVL